MDERAGERVTEVSPWWAPHREKEETPIGGRRQAGVGNGPGRGEGRWASRPASNLEQNVGGTEQDVGLPWQDRDRASRIRKAARPCLDLL